MSESLILPAHICIVTLTGISRAKEAVRGICQGLTHLHEVLHVAHLALKPEVNQAMILPCATDSVVQNVMVVREEPLWVKIADFNVANGLANDPVKQVSKI